jgi:transcriptional regulator with XRE-family HTH domain
MPRPERTIDPTAGPVAAFAYQLRELRRARGLTSAQLAEKTFYARSTLSVAFSGDKLPTWEVVHRIIHACDGQDADEALWRARWDAAHRGDSPTGAQPKAAGLTEDNPATGAGKSNWRRSEESQDEPDPHTAQTLAELATKLEQFRQYQGVSWRQLAELSESDDGSQRLSETLGPLPASSLHDAIVIRRAPSLEVVLRVVQLCRGTPEQLVNWGSRWEKVVEDMEAPAPPTKAHPEAASASSKSTTEVLAQAALRFMELIGGSWERTLQVAVLLGAPLLITVLSALGGVYVATHNLTITASQWAAVVGGLAATTVTVVVKRFILRRNARAARRTSTINVAPPSRKRRTTPRKKPVRRTRNDHVK